jgi:hypothetical protein
MLRHAALLLIFPLSAFAEDPLCEPLKKISAKVNYCDENRFYVPHARKCFKEFKAALDAENAKIKPLLDQQVKETKEKGQDANFHSTEAALQTALATLGKLLIHGKRVYNEIDAYSFDLVLPIYEPYPEDYDLDPDSKEGQEVFREKECYGEPMEDLDKMKADLKKIITELELAKTVSTALSGKTVSQEERVDSAAKPAAKPDARGAGAPGKVPVREAPKGSDISGTEKLEDK